MSDRGPSFRGVYSIRPTCPITGGGAPAAKRPAMVPVWTGMNPAEQAHHRVSIPFAGSIFRDPHKRPCGRTRNSRAAARSSAGFQARQHRPPRLGWLVTISADARAAGNSDGRQLGPAADVELVHEAGNVLFDRLGRQVEPATDGLIREPICYKRQHFHLAVGNPSGAQ